MNALLHDAVSAASHAAVARPAASLVVAACVVLASMLAGSRMQRWRERRRRTQSSSRRQRIAQQGEDGAAAVLRKAGYSVVDTQPEHTWLMWIDGQPHEVSLRADFVVERSGRRYVADAKTGAVAPDPTSRGTRRQLLEYRRAYDVDGVLLVDMEQRRVIEVEFEGDDAPRRAWVLPCAIGVGSALALMWLWSRATAGGWGLR